MWRKPPDVLGSNLLAETQAVGMEMGLTAPSRSILGSKLRSQYAASTSVQGGLELWKGGGDAFSGKGTPLLIHWSKRDEAPDLAQKPKRSLTD